MIHQEELEISSNAIQRILKKYTPERALSEYIWNGFDANANKIDVRYVSNEFNEITRIEIRDDGFGIDFNKLNEKFKRFHDSSKGTTASEGHKLKGKNGYGRLTFYKLANDIKWITNYSLNGVTYTYQIKITANRLQVFESTQPTEINGPTGTLVIIDNVYIKKEQKQFINSLIQFLTADFSWFLALNPNKTIFINGERLIIDDYIGEHEEWKTVIDNITFNADYFRWNGKLNEEYSKFYYLNEYDNLVKEDTTRLNKKGDGFWHSVIVKSSFFNQFACDYSTDDPLFDDEENRNEEKVSRVIVSKLEEYLNCKLKEKRKPFIHNKALQFIEKCKDAKSFPQFGSNSWDIARQETLEELVVEFYEIEPQIFVSLTIKQQRILLSLLNMVMDSKSRDDLFAILEGITEISDDERRRFSRILEKTTMKHIIDLSELIKDRLETIEELKLLVFKHELNATERLHLQKFIEKHYWIFGEEYQLVCAEESRFETALRKYNFILHGVDEYEYINHPDKYKEVDLFITGTEFRYEHPQNIVIEIKNPSTIKKLSSKELNQIQKYIDVIQSVDSFNNNQEEWTYFLVGQDYDSVVDMNIRDKESGLAIAQKNYKLYVKKWSQIIKDIENRMHYLSEKINLKKLEFQEYGNLDEIMDHAINNAAAI